MIIIAQTQLVASHRSLQVAASLAGGFGCQPLLPNLVPDHPEDPQEPVGAHQQQARRHRLDEDGVVSRHGAVGDVRPANHPCHGEGHREQDVDEQVEVRVLDADLLEHLPEVQQRAGDLRDQQARHQLRPTPLVGETGGEANDADEVVQGVVQPRVAAQVAARSVVDHVRQRHRQRPHLARRGW